MSSRSSVVPDMVGGTPEIEAQINSRPCKALLDTGSQITTISVSFYNSHLSDIAIQNCSDLLRIEGVGGDVLPYHGFLVCDMQIPLTDTSFFNSSIPVLIVPDTRYNLEVPCLIGTNFLSKIPADQAPLSSLVPHVRSAISVLQLRTEELEKSHGVYSPVIACTDIILPAYSSIVSTGSAMVTVPVRQQIAFIQGTSEDVPVVPGILEISAGETCIQYELVNYSDHPIHVSKGETVANLHQVSLSIPSTHDESQTADNRKFLESFDLSHLSEAEAGELKSFLSGNRDVFAMTSQEMGCTNVVTHSIEMLDSSPFKEKCRPIPPSAYDELRSHLAELQSAGIITESKSPFCSNIVMARKVDGTLRLCVDYRRLNSQTKKDAYNIPRAETLIDSLQGAKYFASLDLFSGYHQVELLAEHQERTAFAVGPLGFFQYRKMPFGLCNSPSTFQRLMERVLEGLTMVTCVVYIDDIIVYAKTREELYIRLAEVFKRLRQAKLTLKPQKCSFFQPNVNFLGHSVSSEGVQCTKKHLEAVASWPEPSNLSELQTYLGFTGFYRRFIPGYSVVAQPMLKLLRGQEQTSGEKQGVKGRKGQSGRKRKKTYVKVPWEWGEEQRESFLKLKESLLSAPILIYPEYDKPFTLHVDASRKGLGGVLYQERDGKLRVVAYASRSLTGSEKNYTVHKLEFLALKWAVTTKFHHYLYGNKVSIFTDHNPLVYVTLTAKLDANGHRWLAELASYDFKIFYKPGKFNSDADGLSRRPHPEAEQKQCSRVISPEIFQEICNLVTGDNEFAGVAESLGLPPSVVSNATRVSKPVSVDWVQEQSRDPDVEIVRELVSTGVQPGERMQKKQSPGALRLLSHWDTLIIKEGVLYKVSKVGDEIRNRVVIPKHKYNEVLSLIHDDMGHLGRDKTLSVAQERFFWIGLARDVEVKVKTCYRCICAKSPNLPERAPLVSIVTTRPMELVCMDFVGLESSKGGYQNILIIIDHCT